MTWDWIERIFMAPILLYFTDRTKEIADLIFLGCPQEREDSLVYEFD
ncbi:hypothetical protein U2A4042520117 [Corynebacterium striatum]|nr:hypothetical protein U2A4042520117 [Corynebacterium striatum]